MFSSNRILLFPALAGALLLGACGSSKEEAKKSAANEVPVSVKAVTVEMATVPDAYEATGTVRARSTAMLSARIMGHIREVRVQAGDHVSAGQVVAVLDAREIETGVRSAEAARAEARSAVPEVDNAIAAAKAQLDLAESTWKRMKTLFDQKSITDQEMDEANAKRNMAQAGYRMALAKKAQLEDKIRQADEGLAQAGLQKGYATVTAPSAGVVIERKAEPGMLASPGMPIVTIEQAGAYRFEANVEEAMLAKIRPGMKATVELDAVGSPIQTTVAEIVPAMDPMSRSFTVKLNLPGSASIRSGLFGRARFPMGEKKALAVPLSALVEQGQVQKVYVAEQGSARSRLVTTGLRRGANVEVLSGLNAGEKVIAPVPAGLSDGSRVEVRQ